jgi:hypothetical protein
MKDYFEENRRQREERAQKTAENKKRKAQVAASSEQRSNAAGNKRQRRGASNNHSNNVTSAVHQNFDDDLLELHRPDPDLPPRMDIWPSSDVEIPQDAALECANVREPQLTLGENESGGLTLTDLEAFLESVKNDLDGGWDNLEPENHSLEGIENSGASQWPMS